MIRNEKPPVSAVMLDQLQGPDMVTTRVPQVGRDLVVYYPKDRVGSFATLVATVDDDGIKIARRDKRLIQMVDANWSDQPEDHRIVLDRPVPVLSFLRTADPNAWSLDLGDAAVVHAEGFFKYTNLLLGSLRRHQAKAQSVRR